MFLKYNKWLAEEGINQQTHIRNLSHYQACYCYLDHGSMEGNNKRCHQNIFQNVLNEFVDRWVKKLYDPLLQKRSTLQIRKRNTCIPLFHFLIWWGNRTLLNIGKRKLRKEVIKSWKIYHVIIFFFFFSVRILAKILQVPQLNNRPCRISAPGYE